MTTLLVASEGGHLVELQLLAQRLNISSRAWVTFDSPQSRSLLAGECVHFAPFAGSRDLAGTARATHWAQGLLREHQFDTVVSTGAAIALAVLPYAAHRGADCYYFESAARTSGPSLTGRLLQPFRSVKLFTQHAGWTNRRWRYYVSIFDGFQLAQQLRPSQPQRIVVSLGMHKGYSFRRAVEHLIRIIPDGTEVLWQTGDTDTSGLGIRSHVSIPTAELSRAMAESDAVITHAGIGSIVSALRAGKRPVVLPRRKRFNEHVDDHQSLIAVELQKRDLIIPVEADEIGWADVVQATTWRVEQTSTIMPLQSISALSLDPAENSPGFARK